MLNLDDLKKSPHHPHHATFKNYSRLKIAETLGISPGYLGGVLRGASRPSPELEARIQSLAEAIRAAEAEASK